MAKKVQKQEKTEKTGKEEKKETPTLQLALVKQGEAAKQKENEFALANSFLAKFCGKGGSGKTIRMDGKPEGTKKTIGNVKEGSIIKPTLPTILHSMVHDLVKGYVFDRQYLCMFACVYTACIIRFEEDMGSCP